MSTRSGEPLFKRGWREDKGDAPLKETLAAAMLAAAGWRGTPDAGGALHDPCCGSGTIAIEAAQIACGIAPGLQRRFAFERLLPFAGPNARAWQRLKSHAQSRIHASAVPIIASDVSFRMVDFARRNAQRAGVEPAIEFHGGDALERPAPRCRPACPARLMLNPPYGERIEVGGKAARPRAGHQGDAARLLRRAWPRTGNAPTPQHPPAGPPGAEPRHEAAGAMRLKESRRVPMWNGRSSAGCAAADLVRRAPAR
jgi:putative N6-adenine-specific DNA methylase